MLYKDGSRISGVISINTKNSRSFNARGVVQQHQDADLQSGERASRAAHVSNGLGGGPTLQRQIKGTLLAEHLAALSVTALAVLWLVMVNVSYQEMVVVPRRQVTALIAARVALGKLSAPGQTTVVLGGESYTVTVQKVKVEVVIDGQTMAIVAPSVHAR